ncbi:hypothetical protein MVEN_02494000 [Mycena venus]|uniref:Uncharacterized protein n=1 Tax=Mycena venus TaxID=2733690 RepID=A0A8H6WXK7_9AGAR|nr:hypothetical protein MVEN_02494000 [Mycena venus]
MSKEKFEFVLGPAVDAVQHSTGSLTLAQGRMFGALYESILYGINFILFIGLLYMFFQEKKNNTVAAASFGRRYYRVFTLHYAFGRRNEGIPVDLVQKGVYAAATFFADGLLIFRAYIIFGGKWPVLIVPIMSLLATVGLWAALIHAYTQQAPGTTLFPHKIAQLALASFAMSFVTNVMITIMICIRIWLALRRFKDTGISTSFYKRFMAFTVESGLLYPLVLLITAVFFALDNNGLEILSGSNTQVLGIVPIMLSLQLRLNLSAYDNATAGTKIGTLEFNSDIPGSGGQSSAYDVELDGARPKGKAIKLNPGSTGGQTVGDSLRSEIKRQDSHDLDEP